MKYSNAVQVTLTDLVKLRMGINGLDLISKHRVYSNLGGTYTSHFRGRGIDFQEVRAYQAGDDIRNMDWRVTARSGRAHIKLFQEERERPVYIVLDFSSSMNFGSRVRLKSVTAAYAASLIAWSAAQNGDRIGGILSNGRQIKESRPQGGKRGVLKLIKTTVDMQNEALVEPQNEVNLINALEHLKRVSKTGSLVFVISDFFNLAESFSKSLAHLAKHNELVVVFIYDKLETQLPHDGVYGFTDGQQHVQLNTANKAVRQTYQQLFNSRVDQLVTLCRKYRIHFLSIASDEDIINCINHGFTSPNSTIKS